MFTKIKWSFEATKKYDKNNKKVEFFSNSKSGSLQNISLSNSKLFVIWQLFLFKKFFFSDTKNL